MVGRTGKAWEVHFGRVHGIGELHLWGIKMERTVHQEHCKLRKQCERNNVGMGCERGSTFWVKEIVSVQRKND
jgi:hypothetical protein